MDPAGRVRPHRHRAGSAIGALGAVGFDFDHTLGIDNKLERIAFLRLLERIEAAGGAALGTLDEETARIDELLREQRSGASTIAEAVRGFVRARGVEPDDGWVEAYRDACLAMADEIVVPLPGAAATLAELRRRGVPVALLTNGWNPLQQRKAARVGFAGPVLTSAELGVQKPDGAAFAALAATLGRPAHEIWYVGDDPALDVAGALAAGMRAVWLDAEGKAYPAGIPAPTARIGALRELLDLS